MMVLVISSDVFFCTRDLSFFEMAIVIGVSASLLRQLIESDMSIRELWRRS